jgi:hypothetical protein
MKTMNSRPSVDPMEDPNFDWGNWINSEEERLSMTPSRPKLVQEPGQASGYAPSPPTEPEQLHSDHQSLSAGAQPIDPQAAIYEAKGKAKVT